ncbi:unnamed protein product [Polarella glacialis]|uniref:PPPDE domain-containing protein n=1 Tax=Polarella glacialis TaxID=89957 RepID=A0A813GF60_POLGL|nr:unnamed protein product [Polarella glacialis]
MEVYLELIPQDGHLGPMQVMHWAARVGSDSSSVCYEFECEGVQIGASTTCDHGFKIETRPLGRTEKSHLQIRAWAKQFGRMHSYNVAGSDFGGRNCQDFTQEMCCFLGVGTSQLPVRQARQVEAVAGGAVLAAGALAVGGGLLVRYLTEPAKDGVQWMWGDAGTVLPSMAQLNPIRWSGKQSMQATIGDLEAHLGTASEWRPVLLHGHAGASTPASRPNLAAAIAHLRELSEAT